MNNVESVLYNYVAMKPSVSNYNKFWFKYFY